MFFRDYLIILVNSTIIHFSLEQIDIKIANSETNGSNFKTYGYPYDYGEILIPEKSKAKLRALTYTNQNPGTIVRVKQELFAKLLKHLEEIEIEELRDQLLKKNQLEILMKLDKILAEKIKWLLIFLKPLYN